MDRTAEAFAYFESSEKYEHTGLCCLAGGDAFLTRLVLKSLRDIILDGQDADAAYFEVEGAVAEWRDVADKLNTRSLFGGDRQLVIVRDGDEFVKNFRPQLEDWVEQNSSSTLVLIVSKWPGNTNLAKAVAKQGLTVWCRPPLDARSRDKVNDSAVVKWLEAWAKKQYQLKFDKQALSQLWDFSQQELGMADQAMIKLSLLTEKGASITVDQVIEIVGGWQVKTAFQLMDAAVMGDAASALQQLDVLTQSGQSPQALFGAVSWVLRRFADATRIIQHQERAGQRPNLQLALQQAGVAPYQAKTAQEQLKQIGRIRGGQLYTWLLELDVALKGSHSQKDRGRYAMEMLILKLSRQATPARV